MWQVYARILPAGHIVMTNASHALSGLVDLAWGERNGLNT